VPTAGIQAINSPSSFSPGTAFIAASPLPELGHDDQENGHALSKLDWCNHDGGAVDVAISRAAPVANG
jgi:hypothetical protein